MTTDLGRRLGLKASPKASKTSERSTT